MAEYYGTGIEELDSLLGGGFARGGTVLLQESEEGLADELVLNVGLAVLDEQVTMVVLPRKSLSSETVATYADRAGVSLDHLLDNDQLFVLDTTGGWEPRHNVFPIESDTDVQTAATTTRNRSRARGTVFAVDVTTLWETVGSPQTRSVLRWFTDQLRGRRDFLLAIARDGTLPESVRELLDREALQILRASCADDGRTLTVERAPDSREGETRTMQYLDGPPFVSID